MTLLDAAGDPRATPVWRRSWFLPTVLALAVVANLVVSAFLWAGRDDATPSETAGTPGSASIGMVVAAKQAATDFFSLDYRHAQDDVDKVIAQATGDFKEQYSAQSSKVVSEVTAKKLVTTASIPDDAVAVEYAHGDSGQVLVAVDVVKTQGTTTTQPQRDRARITLKKVGGTWLVANVEDVR